MGDDDIYEETFRAKFARKSRENPIIPGGMLLAAGACAYAAYNFKNRGNVPASLYVLQLRVVAQGCVVGGIMLTAAGEMYKRFRKSQGLD